MSINLDALFFLKCSGIRCVIISFPMFIWGFVSSLIGTNPWLGTPKNPFSTSRICGGASSGAAVCVGSNVVDFAIGKDFSLQCCQVPEFEFSVSCLQLSKVLALLRKFALFLHHKSEVGEEG
jgi:hypothetical protein